MSDRTADTVKELEQALIPVIDLSPLRSGENPFAVAAARHAASQGLGFIYIKGHGIPQSTISAIENNRVQLGVERAKVLAHALKCHPAVLVFPGWTIQQDNAA